MTDPKKDRPKPKPSRFPDDELYCTRCLIRSPAPNSTLCADCLKQAPPTPEKPS